MFKVVGEAWASLAVSFVHITAWLVRSERDAMRQDGSNMIKDERLKPSMLRNWLAVGRRSCPNLANFVALVVNTSPYSTVD